MALQNCPDGTLPFGYLTRDELLRAFCTVNADAWIDWAAGTCNFTNETFIRLLEYAGLFPETVDYAALGVQDTYDEVLNRRQMLLPTNIRSVDELKLMQFLFGGDVTFVGYPTHTGSGSYAELASGLAISATSPHKDAAWDFVRTLFLADTQRNMDIPTNRSAFDRWIAAAMEPRLVMTPDGREAELPKRTTITLTGVKIETYAATAADVTQLTALLDTLGSASAFDPDIYHIICEEALPFFMGLKSVHDVAEIIQSRIAVYITEQMQ